MPKYLITGSYTTQGVKGVMAEGGSGRVAAVRRLIESLGGTLESMYFAFGSDDWYITVDLPNNAAMAEELDAAVKLSPEYRAPGA